MNPDTHRYTIFAVGFFFFFLHKGEHAIQCRKDGLSANDAGASAQP